MRTSDVLKQTKKHLWNGKEDKQDKSRGVCWAIRLAIRDCVPYNTAAVKGNAVIIRIEKALGRLAYVSEWLLRRGYAQPHHVNDQKLMQEYRHRWLDALIAEYKSQGD